MRGSPFLLLVKVQFLLVSASLLAGSVNPAARVAVALMVGPPAITAASFEIPHGVHKYRSKSSALAIKRFPIRRNCTYLLLITMIHSLIL